MLIIQIIAGILIAAFILAFWQVFLGITAVWFVLGTVYAILRAVFT